MMILIFFVVLVIENVVDLFDYRIFSDLFDDLVNLDLMLDLIRGLK